MKKVFFLIALLFTVVCYAAPPPEAFSVMDDVGSVVQDQQGIEVSADVTIDVQEVAFVYLGHIELPVFAAMDIDPVTEIKLPQLQVVNHGYAGLNELNKPPAINNNNGANKNSGSKPNKQHSNFGYPFTAN